MSRHAVGILARLASSRAGVHLSGPAILGAWVGPTTLGRAALGSSRGFASDADADLKKTVLYNFHVQHGGKMVPFAGWSMPVQYGDSIMDSTLHCRSHASLFDVSHMLGVTFSGKDAVEFVEKMVVADVKGLADNTGCYSLFTNEKGGIVDDTVLAKVSPTEVYLVLNAGCADKDLAHIRKYLEPFRKSGKDVTLTEHRDRGLLALQGPAAADALQKHVKMDLSKFYFSNFAKVDINGAHCYLTRTGYTGEDGFEISVPLKNTESLASVLTSDSRVRLAGLGARDALRLEAGLPLYGNDLEEHITPIEAGLTWTVGKARRDAFSMLGGSVLRDQVDKGVAKRRVGLVVGKGAPARSHAVIADGSGKEIGEVTSGAFSPTLKQNIAMGYVHKDFAKAGTEVQVVVRGKSNSATVTKMPFVKTTYYRPQ